MFSSKLAFSVSLFVVALVSSEDLNNMAIQPYASTLPPPFGIPGGFGGGSTFRPPMGFDLQNNPAGLAQPGFSQLNGNNNNFGAPQNFGNGLPQPVNAFPQVGINPPSPFNNNNWQQPQQQQQQQQLGGFTNGFAAPNMMMGFSPLPPTGGMFPPQIAPIGGFPGFTPQPFRPIDIATPPPVIVAKREIPQKQPRLPSDGTFQNSRFPKTFPDNSQRGYGAPLQQQPNLMNPIQSGVVAK